MIGAHRCVAAEETVRSDGARAGASASVVDLTKGCCTPKGGSLRWRMQEVEVAHDGEVGKEAQMGLLTARAWCSGPNWRRAVV
jgi:hypothetical protein